MAFLQGPRQVRLEWDKPLSGELLETWSLLITVTGLQEEKPMSVPRYKAIMLMEFCNTSSRLVMNIASILQADILLLNDPYVLQILR